MRQTSTRGLSSLFVLLTVTWSGSARAAWSYTDHDPNQTRHAEGNGIIDGQPGSTPGVSWFQPVTQWVPYTTARLADLDGDDLPELLMPALNRLRVYGLDGALRWESGAVGVVNVQGVYDVDADGEAEVIALSANPGGRLWIYDGQTGALLWSHPGYTPGQGLIDSETLVGNVDADDSMELAWSSSGNDSLDLNQADFDGDALHPTVVYGAWSGYANANPLIMGDLRGDGRVMAVFMAGQTLVLRDLSAMDPAAIAYHTPSAARSTVGNNSLIDVDGDGELEVVVPATGSSEQGISVLDPLAAVAGQPRSHIVWSCQLGERMSQTPWLYTYPQYNDPADMDGADGDSPEMAIAFYGGFDLAAWQADPLRSSFPCPGIAQIVPGIGLSKTYVFDLGNGNIKAILPNAVPYGTRDLDGDGLAELLAWWYNPANPSQQLLKIYRLQAGALSEAGAFPPSFAPVLPTMFPRRMSRVGPTDLITADTNGNGRAEVLGQSGGTVAWFELSASGVATVNQTNPACGATQAAWKDRLGRFWMLQGTNSQICILDQGLQKRATYANVPHTAYNNYTLLAGNLDASGSQEELFLTNSYGAALQGVAYDVQPEGNPPLVQRFATPETVRHSFLTVPAPGEDPLVVGVSGTRSRVFAQTGTGTQLWSYQPCGTSPDACDFPDRVVSFAAPGKFTDPSHTDMAVVLDPILYADPVNTQPHLVVGLHWNGSALVSYPAHELVRVPQFAFANSQWSLYGRLFVADIGAPGQWGVADGRDDLVAYTFGRRTYYLDVLSGSDLMPNTVLNTTATYIASLNDMDDDERPELGCLVNYAAPAPQAKIRMDLGPDALGPSYTEGALQSPTWTRNIEYPASQSDTFAFFDLNGGGNDMAYVNGGAGLYILDGQTGAILPGFPVYLFGGALLSSLPNAPRRITAVFAFDVSGDDQPEIMAAGDDGWIYAVTFDDDRLPRLLWSMYLGYPVRQMVPADWNGDGNQELVVYADNGNVYGIGPQDAHIAITAPDPAQRFVWPDIVLSGTVSGAESVAIFVNGPPARTANLHHGTWDLPLTLPEGESEIVAEARQGDAVVATDSKTYAFDRDWDNDDVLNPEDCVSIGGHLDPDIYPDAPELCDGKDNDCNGSTDETVVCDDDLPCTDDSCDGAEGCRHVIDAGSCVIAGECYGIGLSPTTNDCLWCQPDETATAWTAKPDGTTCGDSDPCDRRDTCQAGTCTVGGPLANTGDVNQDGMLTAGDAQIVFFIDLGVIQPTTAELCAADCDDDGAVTPNDSMRIFFAAIRFGPGCVGMPL